MSHPSRAETPNADRPRVSSRRRIATIPSGLLASAVESIQEGVILYDVEGRIHYANPAVEKIYGYPPRELIGRNIHIFEPTRRKPLASQIFRKARTGSWQGEVVARRKDATEIRVQLTASPVHAPDGKPIGVVTVAHDLTDRDRAEQERKHLETQLIQSEKLRSLGVMAAGVAHHMNNVLAGVLGQADLLLETTDDEAVRQRLQTIVQSAQDGAAAVNRIKQFAYELPAETSEHVNLATLARDVIDATQPRWKDEASVEGRTIEVDLIAPEPVWTIGVAAQLREALMNVVLNAVDALQAGGKISIELSARNQRAVLRVADNGAGMSDEVLRRVYDPFFTTKPQGKGTGLGLSIAYGIIQRHGGSVEVTSKPGLGTVVEILLPAAAMADGTDQAPEVGRPVRPLRILVVDDEPVLAEQLHAILALDSHLVRVCNGGADALAALEQERFDMVITDLGMPEINGWSVASEAKHRIPEARVGLVTGWTNVSDDLGDPRNDCVDFVIAKPYRVQMVRDAVASALAG